MDETAKQEEHSIETEIRRTTRLVGALDSFIFGEKVDSSAINAPVPSSPNRLEQLLGELSRANGQFEKLIGELRPIKNH